MIIKHSTGSVGSFYDKEKKEWVTVKEPETKEKQEPEKEEEKKSDKQEN